MPRYTFECERCGERETVDSCVADRPSVLRCRCHGHMERVYAGFRMHINTNCLDYVTADITGIPTRINTLNQERELCKRNGVTRVTSDDIRGGRRKKGVESSPESMKESCERAAQELGMNV